MSYVYAVARLRGMENRLLDTSFLSRLMESPTLDDALKALAETSYAQWFGKVAETGFDRAIDDEMLATCRELGQFVPDTDLITLFRMPYGAVTRRAGATSFSRPWAPWTPRS